MKIIKFLPLFLLLLSPLCSKAQRFSLKNLIEVKSMDVSEASSYFEKKGWTLMETQKNPDNKTTEIFWIKSHSMIFRYILSDVQHINIAVNLTSSDKSNFESLKKEAKQLGMDLIDSGVDENGKIFSVYASAAYKLKFSTSTDKKRTYYDFFLIEARSGWGLE